MESFANSSRKVTIVNSFPDLVSTPFDGEMNAICWKRTLAGDFSEIVEKTRFHGNMCVIDEDDLLDLELSSDGQKARETIISDMKLLRDHGAGPTLNIIRNYEKDENFFPTDVYSFHVDRSPVPVDTFLCTYYGDASDILPNSAAEQKVLVPEIREELGKLYDGPAAGFEEFLSDNFFDLHYQPKAGAQTVNLGNGNLWRLTTDFPGNPALPCIHRAPVENSGLPRLLLIC